MTPSAEPVAPASFDSMIDSIAALPSGATQAAPNPPETDDSAPVEDPPALEDAEPAEAAAEEPEGQPEEPLEPPQLNQPDIEEGVKPWGDKAYHVTKPRMEKFVAANKFAQEIQKFAPTVKEAHEQYLDSNDLLEMRSHFSDPEKLDQWAGFWEKQNPNSFAELAIRLPERIQKSHPEIYGQLQQKLLGDLKTQNPNLYGDFAKRAIQERVDALYDEWASFDPITQKAEAELARYRAQQADHQLTGKHRETVTRIDPIERQRLELEKKQQEFDKQKQDHQKTIATQEERQRTEYWNNWNTKISNEKASGLTNEINTILKPVEGKFSKDQLEAFRDRIENVVKRKMQEDFEWDRNRQLELTDMKRTTLTALKEGKRVELTPTVRAYLERHVAYAKPIIAETARVLIGSATAKAVADNKAQHQRSASGQRPGAQGNRPTTSNFKAAKPVAGDDFDSKFEAIGRGERR